MAEDLNTGLLLYLPYRAMEARVFEELAAAGFDDFTRPRRACSNASHRRAAG